MSEFTGIWLPAELLAVEELNLTEKVIAAQVLMLSRSGECTAKNEHLSSQLGLTKTTVSQTLKLLRLKGWIEIEDGKMAGNKRQMYPSLKFLQTLCKNLTEGWLKSNKLSVKILQILYKISTYPIQDSDRAYVKILQTLFKNLTELYIRTESKEESKDESKGEKEGEGAASTPPLPEIEVEAEKRGRAPTPSSGPPPIPVTNPVEEPPQDHRLKDSPYYQHQAFIAALADTDYGIYDLDYYHEVIKNWADSGTGAKFRKSDWIATARGFMLRDANEGKARLRKDLQPATAHVNRANHHRPVRQTDTEFAATIDRLAERRYGREGNQ
jgi:predicted transcriptional regulator